MKVRNGFVSNSSSSSFVISIDMLTDTQIMAIWNHIQEADKHCGEWDFGSCDDYDEWIIEQDDSTISGYTNMDNFDMYTFLQDYLHIPENVINWGD